MYVTVALIIVLILIYHFCDKLEQFDNLFYYIDDIVTSRYSTERVIKQSTDGAVVDIAPNRDADRGNADRGNADRGNAVKRSKTILKRDYNSFDAAWGSERSELSERFFEESNIEYLLDTLRKEVYDYTERVNGTPIDIGIQPRKDFITIMQRAMAVHRQNIDSRLPIETQLTMLNGELIDRVVPKVAGQTVSHLKFLNDISRPYTLVDIPESTRVDSKELRLFSF